MVDRYLETQQNLNLPKFELRADYDSYKEKDPERPWRKVDLTGLSYAKALEISKILQKYFKVTKKNNYSQ